MNPVLILTKNNLELTKRCVESVRAQDIPVSIFVYDNESDDGTQQWLGEQDDICNQSSGIDLGVSAAWNFVLETLFSANWCATHVLVLNNDTQISPWFYKSLLTHNVSFITGMSVQNDSWTRDRVPGTPYEAPDFSAFLIRRECWEKVGPFNEEMVLYCQDCDYHIRAHRQGITLWNSGILFYHERSSTIKNADMFDRREMELRADQDRAVFKRIYGCEVGSPEYAELFK
jgi:GT2 family glycosyltransferase